MRQLLKTVDDLLRGRFTRKEDLVAGRITVPVRVLVLAGLLLGILYGMFMGLYAVLRTGNPSFAQFVATSCKVPLLFLLTLVVTYPSLYVVSALFDSRLHHGGTLRLLLAAMGANLALLASLGPVTGFFTLSTESYPFMIVLNVLFFAIAGLTGLGFLKKALDAVFDAKGTADEGEPRVTLAEKTKDGDAGDERTSAVVTGAAGLARRDRPATPTPKRVFTIWIIIYAVVGAQMGWILRPFIGAPDMQFTLFRQRESNFFEALIQALGNLLS